MTAMYKHEDFYNSIIWAITKKMGIDNGLPFLLNKETEELFLEWIEINVPQDNIFERRLNDRIAGKPDRLTIDYIRETT